MSQDDRTTRLYRLIKLIRRVEEEIIRVYDTDVIKSPVHLSIGQEAPAVAVCDHLKLEDVLYGTYRGHAVYLAKGGDLQRMISELYGKRGGLARGKAGSMHLGDMSVNMIGTSAIVATSLPNALGHAFALKQQNSSAIVTVFFGDGAMEEGVFHETMNFAALKCLPLLFVCENNKYAIYSKLSDRVAVDDFCTRAENYGVSANRVSSGDIFEMSDAAGAAIERVRAGDGPQFIELHTSRWRDHVGPGEDRHIGYRTDAELDEAISKDQVARLADMLEDKKRNQIDDAVEADIAAAIQAAEQSEIPDAEVMYSNVYQ